MVKSSAAIRVAPLGDDSRNDPIRSTSEETSGNRSVPAELGLQQAHSFVDTRLAFLTCLGPEAAAGPRFPWVKCRDRCGRHWVPPSPAPTRSTASVGGRRRPLRVASSRRGRERGGGCDFGLFPG